MTPFTPLPRMLLGLSLLATGSPIAAADESASASIRVDIQGAAAAPLVFSGTPAGTLSGGQSLTESDLRAGTYTTAESTGTPGLQLASIDCNDDNSQGYIATATTRFNLSAGETVTCVYHYRQAPQQAGGGTPSASTSPPDDEASGPAPEPSPGDILSGGDCTPPRLVPSGGPWQVSNLPGTMVCGPMTMPLQPSSEAGTLTVRDCGWTIFAEGMSDDTADLTLTAVDGDSGLYQGTVGGEQDGIPMNIDFEFQLHSTTAISGNLHSSFSTQGISCTMTRPFRLEYTGN